MARAAFRDVSSLLSGSVIAKPFGVASTTLFARILSKDEMAIFPVFLMLAGIPNLVLTFGIFSTFMRELPPLFREDEAQARSLTLRVLEHLGEVPRRDRVVEERTGFIQLVLYRLAHGEAPLASTG